MNRFVLNETSYHGKGAIAAIPDKKIPSPKTWNFLGAQYKNATPT